MKSKNRPGNWKMFAEANVEVDEAVGELTEAISLTDSTSSAIKTAVDAMATANAKFRADGQDPALFGDDSAYHTGNKSMAKVKTYLDRAISYINGDHPNANYDLTANLADIDAELTNEDTELASARMQQARSTIEAVNADLKIPQIDESVTTADSICSKIILDWWKNHSKYYGRDKLFSHTGGIFVDIESVMNGEDVKYCFDNSFNPADSTSYHQKDVFRKSNLVL